VSPCKIYSSKKNKENAQQTGRGLNANCSKTENQMAKSNPSFQPSDVHYIP